MACNMNRGVSASSSSSSSFTPIRWSYDVFLSFRGEDTRNNFTGHLYNALCQRGLHTFIDDHDLRKGEEIGPTLVKAVQESRVSVIVFSENYASSKWCLDELLIILDCKESKGQLVWPIFYKVNPSDVRNQRGSFAVAMREHEVQFNFDMDRVQKWRTALTHAASLSGWHFPGGHESKFIQNIVEEISIQVSNRTYLKVANYPVGLESRIRDVHELLCVEENDVRMVGIWGIGGIGKTTVAKAVYGSIAHRFEGSCFLANVRERSSVPHEGLVQLQETLLSKILGGVGVKLNNIDDPAFEIEKRLWNKRVLIVLDDVDHLKQLENLAGGYSWFGPGSRVIITTRDKHLLIAHGVSLTYKVKALDFPEAFELFSWNSFKRDRPKDDYVQLVERAVYYTKGLPLALSVLGSHLFGRSIEEWQDALDSYERIPNKEVQEILKISFNGLEDHQKEVFLDIACFFKGQDKDFTVDILRSCDLYPIYSIAVLIDKSLLTIGDDSNALSMHDLIEDMGKEIVRQESPTEAGERSRLWFHEDVLQVLTQETGTSKVRGIMIEMPKKEDIHVAPKALLKMRNLRYLINRNASLVGNVGYLPNSLRFLDWYKYPLESLPPDFNPKKLVALQMPSSSISRFGQSTMKLDWLKSMDFSRCESLKEIPDFSGFPNLKKLLLVECRSLVEIHDSVGFLDKLVSFSVQDCSNLTRFPTKLGMKSLKVLNMKGCKLLECFPEIEAGTMEHLREISLESCKNLKALPSSIYKLKYLQQLVVRGSPKLLAFPMSTPTSTTKQCLSDDNNDEDCSIPVFPQMTFLRVGDCNISHCDFLMPFGCLSTLTYLDLSGGSFVSLPTWIIKFVNLQWLILRDCKRLKEIPQLSPSIKGINAGRCKSLERISNFSDILDHRNSLGWLQWSDLSECYKLLHAMDLDVETMASILLNQHDDQGKDSYFEFSVVLPGNNIPKWFSFCKHPTDHEYCEFVIKFPPNFSGKNSRLALSAVFESTDEPLTYNYDDFERDAFHLRVYINGDEIFWVHEHFLISPGSNHVWLQYISLSDMRHWGRQGNEEQILSKCEVRFLPSKPLSLKTCGVQLVCHQKEYDNNDQNLADLQFYKRNYDDLDHEVVQLPKSHFNWYPQQRLRLGALGITLVGIDQEEDKKIIGEHFLKWIFKKVPTRLISTPARMLNLFYVFVCLILILYLFANK